MLEIASHIGADHPELLWIVVLSVLSFVGGVSVGGYVRSRDPAADLERAKAAGTEEQ